jgi:hypothetical protein
MSRHKKTGAHEKHFAGERVSSLLVQLFGKLDVWPDADSKKVKHELWELDKTHNADTYQPHREF